MGITQENCLRLDSFVECIKFNFALGTIIPLTFFAESCRVGTSGARMGDHRFIRFKVSF
jgi:hypothetical protein